MRDALRLRDALMFGAASAVLIAASPVAAASADSDAQPRGAGRPSVGANATTNNASPVVSVPAAAGATTLPEVVVTAEKRSANIQSVPVTVAAFNSKERALKGINTVQDITNFTPGLTYSSQLDRPAIRGLQRSTNIYAADSSVGIYDNDLFTNSTFLVGRDDMIVDQVEVLIGPQNTLYGRNAIGGIINTQSKRPSDEFGGEFREEHGNYEYNKVEGTVTGPISFIPNLTFRLSAFYDEQDKGWIRNVTGKDIEGARHDPYEELQLQYKGERDDLWFLAYNLTFNQDRGGPGSSEGSPETGPYNTALVDSNDTLFFNPNFPYSGGAVPGSTVGQLPGNPTTLHNRITAVSYNTSINLSDAYSFNFHWTHHFDTFDVKYVGGWSQYRYSQTSSDFLTGDSSITSYQIPTVQLPGVPFALPPLTVDGNQGFNFDTKTKWYSHELNFTSSTKGKFSWIAGLYYYNETDNNPETETATTQPQLNASGFNVIPVSEAGTYLPPILGGASPLSIFNPSQAGDYLFLDYQNRTQTTAGFGQVSYEVIDHLKLTGGFRYTYDFKNDEEEARYLNLANGQLASAFGVFTPALDITPGLVSFAPEKGVVSPVEFPTTGKYAGDATRHLADYSRAPTGTAAIEYTPDHDTLAYARYNRGYKAFAFNAGFVGANVEAKPEFVNDYEIGIKKTINHNIQIDIDGFYYDYSNDQVPIGVPTSTPLGPLVLTQFTNLPKAVSDGVELSALWSPIPHLNLSVTYGFDNTSISTACTPFTTPTSTPAAGCYIDPVDPFAQAKGAKPVGPATAVGQNIAQNEVFQSVKGNSLPQAPKNKVAFNTTYTWFFAPGNLTLSGSYIWRDHEYASIFTRTQYDYAPSFSQVDLRATFSGNHDHYELVLYVKNLFDTLGYDAAAGGLYNDAPQGGGGPTYNPTFDLTPPRLFGGEVHYKF